MIVNVLFFAQAAEFTGCQWHEIELSTPATVADCRRALAGTFPQLAGELPSYLIAVNCDYAGDDADLRHGDEVAVIPPVGGG